LVETIQVNAVLRTQYNVWNLLKMIEFVSYHVRPHLLKQTNCSQPYRLDEHGELRVQQKI